MSAHESLSPDQFRMPMEDFKQARSSDYGVPLHEVMGHMEANYRTWEANGRGNWPEVHGAEIEHGGPRAYVDHLKADIAANGLQHPPVVNDRGARGFLVEGHHRGVALMELGGDSVPYTPAGTSKRRLA